MLKIAKINNEMHQFEMKNYENKYKDQYDIWYVV
jgi:hypothetical protein